MIMDEGMSRLRRKFVNGEKPLNSRLQGILNHEDDHSGRPNKKQAILNHEDDPSGRPKKKQASYSVRGRRSSSSGGRGTSKGRDVSDKQIGSIGHASKAKEVRGTSEGRCISAEQIGSTGHGSATSAGCKGGRGSSGSASAVKVGKASDVRSRGGGSVGQGLGFLGKPISDVYTYPTYEDRRPPIITKCDHLLNNLLDNALAEGDIPDHFDDVEDEDQVEYEAEDEHEYQVEAENDEVHVDAEDEAHDVDPRRGQKNPITPETSSSVALAAAATAPSTRKRRPCSKFRGVAQPKKPPKDPALRQIVLHGKHHFYGGSVRTLMSCIFKSYHTGVYATWKDWSPHDKELCWQRFQEFYVFREGTDEELVRTIFFDYGAANWPKFLFNARELAKIKDPNFYFNSEAMSPVEWIGNDQWRELCSKVWSKPTWQARAGRAKVNRKKEKNKMVPLCGNKPLEERLDTEAEPTQYRALEICHQKPDGTWSSTRAAEIAKEYKAALIAMEDAMELENGHRPTPLEVDVRLTVYGRVTGGPSKGRFVGLGRMYTPQTHHSRSSVSAERVMAMEQQLASAQEREQRLEENGQRMKEEVGALQHRQEEMLAEHEQLKAEMKAEQARLREEMRAEQAQRDREWQARLEGIMVRLSSAT